MSSSQASPGPPATPPAGAGDAAPGNRSASMIQTAPSGRTRRRHMKRTRSAPDCKHGAKKIKVGVCAMDKKAQSKPMCEILARLTAGGEFEVVLFGDKVILNEPVESWPLCDVLLSWHSEGFPLRKAQQYVELRHPFLINDVHSQDLLLDRRRVYKTLQDHNIPIPRHILVNREPAPAPEPSSEPQADIDELTTSSSSAGSSPRAGRASSSSSKAAAQTLKPAAPATADSPAAAAQPGDAAPAAAAGAADNGEAGDAAGTTAAAAAAAEEEVVLLDPPGFVEEEDYVELDGVRIDKPFVEKPVSGEDHNIHIYYPHSMGGGVKRLFRKVDNKSADYDPHHPGTVRRDGSFIYEEFLTTGGTDVKVYTVGPRYAHAEARKSPVVDGKVNRTPDGKEVRFPVLLSPQEKEIARMVCLAFGQRVCGFDLLRSETGRSYVCDVNGWSFVKNSKKYYDDAAGILRVMILSQLAPQRLTVAPEAPMPLSGLLEEVAAAAAASDGAPLKGPQSVTDGSEDGSGLKMREPSILAAAQPAELGWEEQPSVLADLDAEGGLKEVGSLQDLTSLDGTYEEEGMGTDDSSSTAGVAASELSRNLELRCVLAVIRHGDRTPKQKMKVTVTQAPLIALYNKYKDSKGKQAKLKSPGQLQELLDVVRALLADMEAKSSSQRSSRSSTPAPGGQLTEEEKAQEQHEELREKLRIVRTVLEQGGTFSGINRKVQLKPTKWSTPSSNSSSSKPPTPAPDTAEQSQGAAAGEQPSQPSLAHQQPSLGSKAQPGEGGSRSARTSSTGGGPPAAAAAAAAAAADSKPQVTELLLILKYGGVLTHSGRAQAEELGKTFRMVMYPRYGPAGGGGFLRLHSTYRHDLKIYSSDEGRVQMSAAAFIKGLLDLEGSSLTPILVSLVTKNASMLDAFGKGASDDILNAKNMLYQHLTWDPEKTVSLCSKLALPLATPAIGVTPPVSPKSAAAADESHSPFFSGGATQHVAHAALDTPVGSGGLPASATNSGVSTPTAAAHHNAGFGQESSLPMTSSCMDLLQQGKSSGSGNMALRRGTRASGTGSGTGEQQQQQQGAGTSKGAGGGGAGGGSLVAAATANAAGLHAPCGLSKLTHSPSWSAVRAAEARAAALSGIKAMPDQPLALLFQLVELMKVLVDQLREKCLEERVDAAPNPHSRSSLDKQDAAAAAAAAAAAGSGDKAGGSDKGAAAAADGGGSGADRAAGGGAGLQPMNSARGISSSRYSSLASSPDDWRLDETKPCSGERLLLMFDRWRKLLKSFYNEKKQQFDISKVPDIYDSAKYDAIHNSHLQLSSLADLYRISRQLAAVVVPHEYGLDEQGKLLIGSKICSELLGKLMCDLESMKEESIVTAEIEAQTARTQEAAAAAANSSSSSSRHPSRQRVASQASLLEGSGFDAFESEFGHMSVLDGRMRPPKPPGAPGQRHSSSGQAGNWSGATGAAGGQHARASQQGTAAAGSDGQQQQQQGEGGGGGEEQEADMGEQETLHRLCPTYASDVNSPLRHVRTRIYFTSESHIHSLVNVLRYCHLLCPGSGGSSGLASYGTAAPGSISKASPTSSFPTATAAASTTAAGPGGSGGSGAAVAAAAAAATVQPAADGTSVDAVTTAVAAVSLTDAATPAAAAAAGTASRKPKGTAFASPAAAAAAAASGTAAAVADAGGDAALAGASSVGSSIAGQQQQPQQLLTPEGQTLLAGTDEFDYLTHIVFRMYENKMAAVDAPERFCVEIQFSNGANYDPTVVEPPRHTMPTQPRRLLTNMPGVPLQTFQELAGKFARGKMAPCNYQLQYALRAPLSSMNTISKAPTPGMSRAGSANMGPGAAAAPTPPLPPVPPRPPSPVPTATATALIAAGPGAAPSAPLPSGVAAAAAAAVTAEQKGS